MDNVMQVMGHENCLWQYKSGCTQLVCTHHWVRVSKANQSGAQIRVVQLVS